MQRDEALREAVGRWREPVGGNRPRPRREFHGRDPQRGGEDSAELRVLRPLQVIRDGVRVEAEAGGSDAKSHAERSARPGGQNGRKVVELLRIEDGGIAATAQGAEGRKWGGVGAQDAVREAGKRENGGVARFAEYVDRRIGHCLPEGVERGQKQDGIANAAGTHDKDASVGEVAQRSRLWRTLGAGKRGAEHGT